MLWKKLGAQRRCPSCLHGRIGIELRLRKTNVKIPRRLRECSLRRILFTRLQTYTVELLIDLGTGADTKP